MFEVLIGKHLSNGSMNIAVCAVLCIAILSNSNFHEWADNLQLLSIRGLEDYIEDDILDKSDFDAFKTWTCSDPKPQALIE